MDCIIPGPSIRPFCAAIGCLSRIGKELYIDFDPVDGLSIRSLNDSKSVFSSFHFEPGFFSRCTSAVPGVIGNARTAKRQRTTNTKTEPEHDDERWTVRIAMKALAAVVRQRKDILNLRITTAGDHLAFEFKAQKVGGSVVGVTHKVGYSTAQGVAAVTTTDGASELVIQPKVLSTMLEPLRRSVEIALLVNEPHRLVSSVSFAHDDLPDDTTTPSGLNRETPNASSLKTETSISYDDLVDVHYVGHADGRHSRQNRGGVEPPDDLETQVVLVFTLKEFKAFLQYCSQALVEQELRVQIQFFWGGKPIVAKTEGEKFSATLVMATLDHKLLGSMKTSATGSSNGPSNNT